MAVRSSQILQVIKSGIKNVSFSSARWFSGRKCAVFSLIMQKIKPMTICRRIFPIIQIFDK
jgi:hypothetical protein